MDDAAIADTLAAYTRATENAVAIGFDTVEIHGAHGYLIDDFFWHVSNTRDDEWGGATLRERTRFAVEVVRAVKSALPADMPLIFRLSQWKGLDFEARVAHTPAEMEQWFEPLAEAGVDIFHCSQRRFWEPAIAGSHLNLAGWAKRVTGKVAITVGSVGLSGEFIAGGHSTPVSIDGLLDRMSHGEFDLVAVGRALLADPEWIVKIREGRTDALKPYDPSLKKVLY
jgi:2,4-dienoyl-CoA reductase-like NADH-dependent reductase (Old Yellow Enzyme family)